jgi:hypothetical protein
LPMVAMQVASTAAAHLGKYPSVEAGSTISLVFVQRAVHQPCAIGCARREPTSCRPPVCLHASIASHTHALRRSCVHLWGRDAGEADDADGARDGPPSSRRPVAFTVDIAGGRRVAPKPVLSSEIAEVVVTEKRLARGQPSGGTALRNCDGAVLSDQPHPPSSASLHAYFHTLRLHSISFTEIGSGRRRMGGWA